MGNWELLKQFRATYARYARREIESTECTTLSDLWSQTLAWHIGCSCAVLRARTDVETETKQINTLVRLWYVHTLWARSQILIRRHCENSSTVWSYTQHSPPFRGCFLEAFSPQLWGAHATRVGFFERDYRNLSTTKKHFSLFLFFLASPPLSPIVTRIIRIRIAATPLPHYSYGTRLADLSREGAKHFFPSSTRVEYCVPTLLRGTIVNTTDLVRKKSKYIPGSFLCVP